MLIYFFQFEKGLREKNKTKQTKPGWLLINSRWTEELQGNELVCLKINYVWLLAQRTEWNLIDMVFAMFSTSYTTKETAYLNSTRSVTS